MVHGGQIREELCGSETERGDGVAKGKIADREVGVVQMEQKS